MSSKVNERLQALLNHEKKAAHTHTILLGVQSEKGGIKYRGAIGDATPDSPYFIASVTKMYTTAVLLALADQRKLDLDAEISRYLPAQLLDGLHVYKGTDYSRQLKVYQLIHQTSGLADYFEGSLLNDFKQNRDQTYSVADTVDMARKLKPRFAPDSSGGRKSFYADTNYQLLGEIIESLTEQSLADVFRIHIFERLNLTKSYLFQPDADIDQVLPLYHKDQPLHLPQAMASERGAGAIVSTVPDSLRFLRAYFNGELFQKKHFPRLYRWNRLFFPMQYGYGLMRFKLPRLMTLFRKTPELIGHSGSSGSFAFYAPEEKLYFAGTFNQLDEPARPFNFLLRASALA